jgi:hypothetical protein
MPASGWSVGAGALTVGAIARDTTVEVGVQNHSSEEEMPIVISAIPDISLER